jgi:hypothetical protein
MRVRSILSLAILMLNTPIQTLAQRPVPGHKVMTAEAGNCFGGNKIAGTPPKEYEGLLVFWIEHICICRRDVGCEEKRNLEPDANGRIAVCGRVVFKGSAYPQGDSDSDGKYLTYEFAQAHLTDIKGKPIQLIFRTKQRDGVSYRFTGRYLGKSQAGASADRIQLVGTMTKLKSEKRVSRAAALAFAPYNIKE